ncbi:MAG TPA: phosphoenolpyruvate--protein phosphotransferase, partial [Candidatus Competibacteraceae bacterium]|nr:phosphoenolpyruvate--protein phosphotransferase [Candidatus Competibacteraceae bacterium]
IRNTIRAGQKAGIPVSLCGEMAGDSRYTRLLLGLGLTQFSMHPAGLLEIKRVVQDSHVSELAAVVRRLLHTTEADKYAELLKTIAQN